MCSQFIIYASAVFSIIYILAAIVLSFIRKDIYRVNFISGKILIAVFDLLLLSAVLSGQILFTRALLIIVLMNLLIFINSASLTKSGMNNVSTPHDIEDRLKNR